MVQMGRRMEWVWGGRGGIGFPVTKIKFWLYKPYFLCAESGSSNLNFRIHQMDLECISGFWGFATLRFNEIRMWSFEVCRMVRGFRF